MTASILTSAGRGPDEGVPIGGFSPWPAVAGAAALTALVVSADGDDGFVLCPFRRCTGGYCPGCGGTRAVRNLVRGDLSASWGHNPWVILGAVQIVVALGVGVALLAFADQAQLMSRLRRAVIPLLLINTVALIAIWVVRLQAGSIPTGLF